RPVVARLGDQAAAGRVVRDAVAVVVEAVAHFRGGQHLAHARTGERPAGARAHAALARPEPRGAARPAVAHLGPRAGAGGLVDGAVAVVVHPIAQLGRRADAAHALDLPLHAHRRAEDAARRRSVHRPAAARHAHAGEHAVVDLAVAVVVDAVAHLRRRP